MDFERIHKIEEDPERSEGTDAWVLEPAETADSPFRIEDPVFAARIQEAFGKRVARLGYHLIGHSDLPNANNDQTLG